MTLPLHSPPSIHSLLFSSLLSSFFPVSLCPFLTSLLLLCHLNSARCTPAPALPKSLLILQHILICVAVPLSWSTAPTNPPTHPPTHKHTALGISVQREGELRQTLDCLLSCVLFFSFSHSQPESERRQSFFYFPFLSVWGISLLVHLLGRVCYTFSPLYPTFLRLLWGLEVWMWERSEQGFLFSVLLTFGDGLFFLVGLAYAL